MDFLSWGEKLNFEGQNCLNNILRISCIWVIYNDWISVKLLNPFVPNAPFFYHLKTETSPLVFWWFQGAWNGLIWLADRIWLKKHEIWTFIDVFEPSLIPLLCVNTKYKISFDNFLKNMNWREHFWTGA